MDDTTHKAIDAIHDSHVPRLKRMRQLSQLLDGAIIIPGTKQRIGLDPILGLIPGGGDTVSAALSGYIIIEAARMGLPREALMRMVSNLVLDNPIALPRKALLLSSTLLGERHSTAQDRRNRVF